ncbi:helix-turn-helix transcriptional regulator [Amycolatopsis sp. NPDC006131]|uniref:helix-turn-helix domain-containing protein n=1 Tax=Amycolatopsis sp. NPDC006131 TaxID=3156731 RepID=UPI0033BF057A
MTEIVPIPQPTEFGVMARAKRKQLGWSLSETARRAGIGFSTVRQAELGYMQVKGGQKVAFTPTPRTVRLLAIALGIPVADALRAAGHTPDPDDHDPVPAPRPATDRFVMIAKTLQPLLKDLAEELSVLSASATAEPDRLAS